MKKYFSYTKYQELKNRLESYQEALPRLDKAIEKTRLLLDKRLLKKTELMLRIDITKNKIKSIRAEYEIPVKKYKSERVTNTPLPKRWRKKE